MDRDTTKVSSRDPLFMTIRRGGSLTDSDHRLLAMWAADCAERVVHLFEEARPGDDRPRQGIERAWALARGEIRMIQAREAAYAAHAAAREAQGAAREAARAAGHAVAVAHMADHELGASAYALRAVHAAAPEGGQGGGIDQGTAMAAGASAAGDTGAGPGRSEAAQPEVLAPVPLRSLVRAQMENRLVLRYFSPLSAKMVTMVPESILLAISAAAYMAAPLLIPTKIPSCLTIWRVIS